MGAFNSLDVTIDCPACQTTAPREIQFRYGTVWQYRYQLGDTLRWDRDHVGDPDASGVVLDGWLCECPSCDHDGRIAVYVRENVLTAVGPVEDVPQLAELEWLALSLDLGGIILKADSNSDERMGFMNDDLHRRPLTYTDVGSTAPAAEQWPTPAGWRAYEHTVRLGSGTDLWDTASSAVHSWGIKTRSGFTVRPALEAGRSARQGERYWLVARIGPFRVREPVEIITTVSTSNRAALSYGTLDGHPVSGEEAFIVHRGRRREREPDAALPHPRRPGPVAWALPVDPGRPAGLPASLPPRPPVSHTVGSGEFRLPVACCHGADVGGFGGPGP